MATIKQKKAVKNLVGNGGNVTKAMKEAGYSENTANTPQKLTESGGFIELMDQYFGEDDLLMVHKEGLGAFKGIYRNNMTTGKIERVAKEPDFGIRHKYLETAYKIRNLFSGDEIKNQLNIIQLFNMNAEERKKTIKITEKDIL